jgi:uncharacterized protein YoxC
MICPKCSSEITEDTDFCGICGAKLADFADQTSYRDEYDSEHSHSRKSRRAELRRKFISRLKLAGGIIAVIAVVVVALFIVSSLKKSEGQRIFDNVPLGRTVDIVEKDTGVAFEVYSAYDVLADISSYSYVKESEESVSVEGIRLPEWAVMLSKNTQNNINKVSYYDFAALKSSWMGEKRAEQVDQSTIEYGMKIADVKKLLGLSPYVMIAMLDNNTTECIFRYNIADEDGNTKVYSLSVFVDDADETVKDVSETEKDYISFFLSPSESAI